MGWFSGDELKDAGFDLSDGSEFRRARIYFSGEVPGGYYFKAEYEFAGGVGTEDIRPIFTDVYMGKKDVVGSGDLQVGHFKEPFGLEALTSANYLTFMERGSPEALVPFRNDGLMLAGTMASERATWAVGVFRANTDNAGFSSEDGGYAGTGRLTYAPIYARDGERVLHVGVDYSRRDLDGARYRSRPEAHLLPNFIDTGTLDIDDLDLYDVELAGVLGPFSAQGEYILASSSGGTDADFAGWYVEASYFLTGEHRPYELPTGAFGRVIPDRPAGGGEGGRGAWQVAARVSSLDFEEPGVSTGKLDGATLGLNWHLNSNMRIMFNYGISNVDDDAVPVDDSSSAFMIRLQADW